MLTHTSNYPFAITTGQGLGQSYSSREQITELLPSRSLGRAGLKCYVNMTNGNVMIHDRQFHLKDKGEAFEIGYVYNSLATDVSKAWRLSASAALKLPAKNGSATLTVTERDSHETIYRYNRQDDCYYATEFAEGRSVISFDKKLKCWTYYHPRTRTTEIFNDDGQVKLRIDAKGNATNFIYDDNKQLTHVHMQSGTEYEIVRNKDQVAIYRINDKRVLLQHYQLDKKNRLLSSESPGAEKVNYIYDNTTQQLSGVAQTDKTTLAFNYERNKKLASVTVGENELGNINHFYYEDKQSIFVDASGNKTILALYDNGHLRALAKETNWRNAENQPVLDCTRFTRNAAGQVECITYPDESKETFLYSPRTGLLTQHVNRDGKIIDYYYQRTELKQDVLVLQVEQHPKNNYEQITRYVYETLHKAHSVLRFTISPEGRVTEYLYDDKSLLIKGIREYLDDFYPTTNKTYEISLEEIEKWKNAVALHHGLSQTKLRTIEYDENGRVMRTLCYAQVDAHGEGIIDENTSEENNEWNVTDQLTSKKILTEVEFQNKKCILQRFVQSQYDHNSADVLVAERLGVGSMDEQVTQYQYDLNQKQITYPDQHSETIVFNTQGLIEKNIDKTQEVAQETQFTYASNGDEKTLTLPGHTQQFSLYDKQRCLTYAITAMGKVVQTEINKQNNYLITTEYANLIDTDLLAKEIDEARLQAALIKNAEQDRKRYQFFDSLGRDRYVVDALGYVVEYRYDDTGNVLAKIEHDKALSEQELQDLLIGQPLARTPVRNHDRITSYFYDKDNLKIAEQDPAGYVTTFVRDAGGRIRYQVTYAKPDKTFTTNLSQLRLQACEQDDAVHYYFYDNRGQCIGEVDAEGHVTKKEYYPHGKLKRTISYEHAITAEWYHSPISLPTPPVSVNDHQVDYGYDDLDRLICKRGPFNKITIYAYDEMNRKIRTAIHDVKQLDKTDGDHYRCLAQQYDGLGNMIAEANPLVAELLEHINNDVSRSDAQADKEAVWKNQSDRYVYENSLKIRAIDPHGNVTRFYYDKDHRLVLTISHEGAVIQTAWNTFGEMTKQRCYATFMNVTQLETLTGGILDANLVDLLTQLKNDECDAEITFEYDKRGQVYAKTDAEKNISHFTYNAFKECEREEIPSNDAHSPLTVIHDYDARGLEIETTQTSAQQGVITHVSKKYDNLHGKLTCVTDAREFNTRYKYDRLGRLIQTHRQVDKDTEFLDEQCVYDAFNRLTAITNALQQTTRTDYDDSRNRQTVTHANGDIEVIDNNIFSQPVKITQPQGQSESFEHAAHGELRTHYRNDHQQLLHTEHDLTGRVMVETDANKVKTKYTYVGNQLTEKVEDANDKKLKTVYTVNAFGKNEKITDPKGIVTKHEYNRKSQVVKTTRDPSTQEHKGLDITTSYAHNPQGEIIAITQGDANLPNQTETVNSYDVINRLLSKTIDPQGLNISHAQNYDACGNVISEMTPLGYERRHFYNGLGKKCFTFDPIDNTKGRLIQWVHDKVGNLSLTRIYAKPVASAALTNLSDLLKTQQDLESKEDKETQVFYDERQRERFKVNYLYDAEQDCYVGQLEEIRYNSAGHEAVHLHYANLILRKAITHLTTVQLSETIAELQGHPHNRITRKVYDASGKEKYTIDAAGHIRECCYDDMGRLVTEIHRCQPFSRLAELLTIEDAAIEKSLPPLDVSQAIITHYIYDALGNLAHKVNPQGGVTRYSYDENQNCVKKIKFQMPLAVMANHADVAAKVSELAVDLKDSVTTFEYDSQNRLKKSIDALGHEETFDYDALGNNTLHVDRNKQSWTFHYDKARRLIEKVTPEIEVTDTQYVPGSKLLVQSKKEKITRAIKYDADNNIRSVIEGAGRQDARTFNTYFDALDRLIRTEIPNVAIDDYSKPSSFTDLPEDSNQTLTTEMIYNTLGQKVAEKNTGNHWHFYTYDSLGRLRYEVNSKGAVTETTYNAFDQINKVIRYNRVIDINDPEFTQSGIPLAVLQQRLIKNADQDRTIQFAHDALGNVTQIEMDEIYFYSDDQHGVAKPMLNKQFDIFGNCIQESKLIEPGLWAHKRKWYDALHQVIAETDENNYLTTYQRDAFGKELRRKEYHQRLNQEPDVAWSLADLQANVSESSEDREYFSIYDELDQKISEGLLDVVSQKLNVPASGPCYFQDAPKRNIHKNYTYSPEQKKVGITQENGLSENKYYDARHALIGETKIPRVPYDAFVATPITPLITHGVNPFSEIVKTTMHALSPDVVTKEQLPHVEAHSDDREEIKVFDIKGQLKFKQDAEGHLFAQTFTATGQLARSFNTNTTWAESKAGLIVQQHIDEKRYLYDSEALPIQYTIMRDNQVEDVKYTNYNTFGEFAEEHGYGTHNDVYQYYNRVGQPWISNRNHGAVTIKLHDLASRETLSLQSATQDLASVYSPSPALARENLAEILQWDTATLERTKTTYDLNGQVNAIYAPFWHAFPANGWATKSFKRDRWHNILQEADSQGHLTDRKYNHFDLEIETKKPETTVLYTDGHQERKRPTITHGFDVSGGLIGIRDAKGNTEGYILDTAGQVEIKILPNGLCDETNVMNVFGEVTHSYCARNLITYFQRNKLGLLTHMTLPGGREHRFDYDHVSNRNSTTHPNNYSYRFNWDVRGNITEAYQPLGDRTLMRYDSNHELLVEVKPNGYTQTWIRDYFGGVKEYKDLSGVITRYEKDKKNQIVREYAINPRSGRRLLLDKIVTGSTDSPVIKYNPRYEDDIPLHLKHNYAFGLKYEVYDIGEGKRYYHRHDSEGRRDQTKIWDSNATLINEILAKRDELGRETETINNFVTATGFNSRFTQQTFYDENDNRKLIYRTLDPAGYGQSRRSAMQSRLSWYDYDAADRITISDGVKIGKDITIASGHGVAFRYKGDLRTSEIQVVNGVTVDTTLVYTPEKQLEHTYATSGLATHRTFAVQAKTGMPVTSYSEVLAGNVVSAKTSYFDANMRELVTDNWTPEFSHQTVLEYVPLWDIAWRQTGKTTEVKSNQLTIDSYTITPIGYSEFLPYAVKGKRTKYGKVTKGDSAQVYTPQGMINGKWNAADEQEVGMPDGVRPAVHFDTTYEGWMLNKQAVTTTPIAVPISKGASYWVPPHTQSYYFFVDVQGKFLGEYTERTNFDANAKGPLGVFSGREAYPRLGLFTCPEFNLAVGRTAATPAQTRCNPYVLNDTSYPAPQPKIYAVRTGDTFASIAEKESGDAELGEKIAKANGFLVLQRLSPGYTLFIPAFISAKNKAGSYHNYQLFMNIIQGSLLPFMKTPQPTLPKPHGVFWKTLVKVIAVSIAMTLVPQMSGLLGSILLHTLGISTATGSMLAMVLDGIAAGINEAIAQEVTIGLKAQEHFSLSEAIETSLTYGLVGKETMKNLQTMHSVLQLGKEVIELGKAAVEAQLLQMMIDSRSKFEIGAVGLQISTLILGAKLNPELSALLGNSHLGRGAINAANTLMHAALSKALYHTPINIESLSAQAIGNAIGDVAASQLDEYRQTRDSARQQHQVQDDLIFQTELVTHTKLPSPTLNLTRGQSPDMTHMETTNIQPKLNLSHHAIARAQADYNSTRAQRWQNETLQRGTWQNKNNASPLSRVNSTHPSIRVSDILNAEMNKLLTHKNPYVDALLHGNPEERRAAAIDLSIEIIPTLFLGPAFKAVSPIIRIGGKLLSELLPRVGMWGARVESIAYKVSTGGLRNEISLTTSQKSEMSLYAIQLGVPEEAIVFSENMNTSYKMLFGSEKLYIGTDVLPALGKTTGANARISWRGALAHEIVGHRAAELAGMTHTNIILEEAQASIRAARFAPNLTSVERYTLLRDAIERIQGAGLKIRDIKNDLWINEHELKNSFGRSL